MVIVTSLQLKCAAESELCTLDWKSGHHIQLTRTSKQYYIQSRRGEQMRQKHMQTNRSNTFIQIEHDHKKEINDSRSPPSVRRRDI